MKLNELHDNVGARKKRMRVGRGEGSGKGKTCGSGMKGQKARSGVSINGFEGGQNPLYRRLPKRGFDNSMFEVKYQIVNLEKIEQAIAVNKINSNELITSDILFSCGLIGNLKEKIKLLGRGSITSKININVHAVSSSARSLIEAQNGTVTLV